MATDFWSSSHYNRWIVDRVTLAQARADDLQYAEPKDLALLNIFFANVIAKLGKKLELRQQVIATATVFLRRFYLRSSYCETDPFFVAAACCYLAAKTEETPVHLKSVVSEARSLFSSEFGIRTFPSDHSKLGEMEFYLLEDLDFNLIVYHPYRDLIDLCGIYDNVELGEEGEVGYVADKERFWGTGKGKLHIDSHRVQNAWFIINDSYRTELCLLYPPYIIAAAAFFISCVLEGNILDDHRRSMTSASEFVDDLTSMSLRDEVLTFLAGINVSLETIASIAQEIMSTYSLWDSITDGTEADALSRIDRREARGATRRDIPEKKLITEKEIVAIATKMREDRERDQAHPATGRPLPVNKRLERAMGA